MDDITQLSLFSQYQPHDDRPLPLRVAEKWSFSLTYVDQTGDPDSYLYCARDWYIGLGGDKTNWSKQKGVWLSEYQPILIGVKREFRPIEKLEFVNAEGLYVFTQRMYSKSGQTISDVRIAIINYLAKCGVLIDSYRLNAGKQISESHLMTSILDNFQPSTEQVPEQFIYFIAALNEKMVKIGVSTNPQRRLETLQTGSPVKLTLLGFIPGTINLESDLHKQFNHLRSHGEWFRLEEDLEHFISTQGIWCCEKKIDV